MNPLLAHHKSMAHRSSSDRAGRPSARAMLRCLGYSATIACAVLLTGCDHSQMASNTWNTQQAEASFRQCMSIQPPPRDPASLHSKIEGCEQMAWATSRIVAQ